MPHRAHHPHGLEPTGRRFDRRRRQPPAALAEDLSAQTVPAGAGRRRQARGVSRTDVALAWLLKHPAQIQPVIGSTNPDRIRQAAKAADLELTREEWYRLLIAARGEPLP